MLFTKEVASTVPSSDTLFFSSNPMIPPQYYCMPPEQAASLNLSQTRGISIKEQKNRLKIPVGKIQEQGKDAIESTNQSTIVNDLDPFHNCQNWVDDALEKLSDQEWIINDACSKAIDAMAKIIVDAPDDFVIGFILSSISIQKHLALVDRRNRPFKSSVSASPKNRQSIELIIDKLLINYDMLVRDMT